MKRFDLGDVVRRVDGVLGRVYHLRDIPVGKFRWGACSSPSDGGLDDDIQAAIKSFRASLRVEGPFCQTNDDLERSAVAVVSLEEWDPYKNAASIESVRVDKDLPPELLARLEPQFGEKVRATTLGAQSGEDKDRSKTSPEARAAWSSRLRELQALAREKERNQVVVDRDFEDWE